MATAGNAVPVIAAAVVRARRRILSRLEHAGATSAEAAVALEPERRLERKALDYFRWRGIVLEPRPGHYFLVPEQAAEWRRSVRARIVVALAAVVAAAAAVFAINA